MWKNDAGRRRALVTGIDDYDGTDRDLPSCVADARRAAAILRDTFGFDNVIEMHDSEVTLEAVSRALGLLLDGVTPADRIVFYYSGHGTQTVRNGEIRESLVLYDLLLHDDVLVAATQEIPLGVFTVVLDACFSGGLYKRLDASRIKSATIVAKSTEHPVAYRPFGCDTRPNAGAIPIAKKARCVKASPTGEPQLNALLVSACLENETAAASTPSTQQLSALTYAFSKALAEVGPGMSVEAVLGRAVEILRDIGIVQTPQLHSPLSPPMNARTPFLVEEIRSTEVVGVDDLLLRVMNASLNALRSMMQEAAFAEPTASPGALAALLRAPERGIL
jgi:hypothetical protein